MPSFQRLSLLIITFFLLVSFSYQLNKSHKSNKPGLQLVWSDEFNYTGLPDSTKWNYDIGGDGWGNHELEFYTNKRLENARVENGNLIIEARKENGKQIIILPHD